MAAGASCESLAALTLPNGRVTSATLVAAGAFMPPGGAGRGNAAQQYSALPAFEFGGGWPQGVPLQIHMMEDDEWAQEDLPAARELAERAAAELFLYPGDKHLFADDSTPDYDEHCAALLRERVHAFLEK